MTPADERILKLIAKWRASLELHAGYARLSDDQYWLVQPWPKHQRPTAWVIQLAQQRLEDLERIVKARVAAGDNSISEALELMSFLANLVGAQNVERFVPIAEPEQERPIAGLQGETGAVGGPKRTPGSATARPSASPGRALPSATRPAAAAAKPAANSPRAKPGRASAAARAAETADATGEMPALRAASRVDATSEMPTLDAGRPLEATGEMPTLAAASRPDATREMPALTTAARADATAEMPEMGELSLVEDEPESPLPDDKVDREILRDAVRLLGWGREWHELPEAIARMAGRPDRARIRRILKTHQAAIQREAATGSRPH